jgi:hypothetical protein
MTDPTLTKEAQVIIEDLHRSKRSTRKIENRSPWLKATALAGAFIMGVACAYLVPAQKAQTETTAKESLASKTIASADTQLTLCTEKDATAQKLEQSGLCQLAFLLKQEAVQAGSVPSPAPGQNGVNGKTGENGRGILSTAIVGDRFKVTYSDGVTEDKGVIKGQAGINGQPGVPGRGITGSSISNSGHLVLLYSDNQTEDLGVVVGKDGKTGEDGKPGTDGAPGRGITALNAVNSRLVVTYTDGSTADVGPLPIGPKGNDGAPPVSWTQHYADGSSAECKRVPDFDYNDPHYDCPVPTQPTPTSAAPLRSLGGR